MTSPYARTSIPATRLIAAMMDRAELRAVVLTEEDLRRVDDDELTIVSAAQDPSLPRGAYRLIHTPKRSPIIIEGRPVEFLSRPDGPLFP